MGKRLLVLCTRSLKRRWREITRVCIAIFFAVFFITGVLLFQENMYQWQMAANKERFGDWLVMETNTRVPNETIVNHPYMDGYCVAQSAVKLYDENWKSVNRYVGYMSPDFLKQSYIDIELGRMPSADNEVAIDWNTLLKLGYTNELGQTVTLNYYDKNDIHNDDNQRQEEFILVGILESYTDVWKKGKNLPGVLVTKERYDVFDSNAQNMFIHRLSKNIKTDDYRLLYEQIKEQSGSSCIYNDYLYDYKPWENDEVYNYMYIIVMVIGILAITYQLIIYKNSRKKSYDVLRKMGADKTQIVTITFMENVLMLMGAGIAGITISAFMGKIVCLFVEVNYGIPFYYVNPAVLLKGFLSIVIAVVVEQLVSRLIVLKNILVRTGKRVKKAHNNNREKKPGLNKNNLVWSFSNRLIKNNSIGANIGIRLFYAAISVVLMVCVSNIYSSYVTYVENDKLPDFVGYQELEQDITSYIYIPMVYPFEKIEGKTYKETVQHILTNVLKIEGDISDNAADLYEAMGEEDRKYLNTCIYEYPYMELKNNKCLLISALGINKSKYAKTGNTSIFAGLEQQFIDTLENMPGVSEVSYAAFETERAWSWGDMKLNDMGYSLLSQRTESEGVKPYSDTYLFATEYLTPTEELYNRLLGYSDDKAVDYDSFARGEQIIVLVNENAYGKYDTTIKPGTDINYHYYSVWNARNTADKYPYCEALYESGKVAVPGSEDYVKYLSGMRNTRAYLREVYEPCVTAKVAGVIYVTDEFKEAFKDVIVNYGYYTAIASKELGKMACEKQNEFIEEYLVSKLSKEHRCELKYNQISVKYDLTASFSATHNVLANYCKENAVVYNSLAEDKEVYRTELINNILRYGITVLAVIVINIVIAAIVAKSRLEARKDRFELLLRMGADKYKVRRICMLEAIREGLWSVFTLPVTFIIQYIMYRRFTKKL